MVFGGLRFVVKQGRRERERGQGGDRADKVKAGSSGVWPLKQRGFMVAVGFTSSGDRCHDWEREALLGWLVAL